MVNFFKKNKKILLIDTIIVFVLATLLIIFKKSLILYNDQLFQYDIYYEKWAHMLYNFVNSGELPFYSFDMYLGTDLYSGFLGICNGNVFSPLMIFFRDNIRIYIIIELILCLYISSLSMSSFLRKENIQNEKIVTLFSLMYSFSGFVYVNIGNYSFLRFYAFLPLLLSAICDFYKTNRISKFILIVTILFMQSYYYMYPTVILMIIYCLYKDIINRNSISFAIKRYLFLIFGFLCGICISAAITLPGIVSVMNNPRVGENPDNSIIFNINLLLSFIQDLIVPNISANYNTLLSKFADGNYHFYQNSFTIGIIPVVASIEYLLKNKKIAILCLPLLLGMIFTKISSAFHGFSLPSFRWTFIIIPLLLLFASKNIEEKKNLNKKIEIATILIIFISFIINLISTINNISDIKVDVILRIFVIICSFVILYLYEKNNNIGILLSGIIYVSMFILITVNQSYIISPKSRTFDNYTIDSLQDTNDDLMYRIFTPYEIFYYDSKLQLNEALREGYMSTSAYCSSISDLQDFHKALNYKYWDIQNDDPNVMKMLGVKYYILPKVSKYDKSNTTFIGYMNGEYPIYEVNEYLGFAHTYDSLNYFSFYNNTKDFQNTLFIDDSNFDISRYNNLENKKMIIEEKGPNFIKGAINVDNENILLIPIPYSKGWKVLDNGERMQAISVNGGFMGLPLLKGENNIEIYYKPPYIKLGIIVSSISVVIFLLVLIIEKRNKKLYEAKNNSKIIM